MSDQSNRRLPRLALALALGAFAGTVCAGFIDERKTAPVPAQSATPAPAPAAGPTTSAVGNASAVPAPAPVATTPDAAGAVALIPAGENRPYQLAAGKPVHTQLIDWATQSGWVLKWSPEHTWEVFADTTIVARSTDQAVEQVIQSLRMEGKPIRLRVYVGNRVMEVEALTIGE